MENTETWYIVKRPQGTCDILSAQQLQQQKDPDIEEQWGPYNTTDEAIARKIGLIRAGKCQPQ